MVFSPDDRRKYQSNRQRKAAFDGNNVSPIPEWTPEGKELYDRWRDDPVAFLVEAFPNSTGLKPFCSAHLGAISQSVDCILNGGKFALLLPRGFGKTTILRGLAIWALLFGHRKFVLVVSCNASKAAEQVRFARRSIEGNPHIAKAFPQVVHCVKAAESNAHRCARQHKDAEPTHLRWSGSGFQLPVLGLDSDAGAFESVPAASALGIVRPGVGDSSTRPDFFWIDDIQTSAASKSDTKIATLEELIDSDLGAAGSLSSSSATIQTCTVRRADDLSARYAKKWDSLTIPLITSFPDKVGMGHWAEYRRLRTSYRGDDGQTSRESEEISNQYYRDNKPAMLEGVTWSWDWAYQWAGNAEENPMQRFMNFWCETSEIAVFSEFNNDPSPRTKLAGGVLPSVKRITAKQSHTERWIAPSHCHTVCIGIDCGVHALSYAVTAFGNGFSSTLLDYGYWPEQRSRDTRYKELSPKLKDVYPGNEQARLLAGINALTSHLFTVDWQTEDGVSLDVRRCVVDRGFETEVVDRACKGSEYPCTPSNGYATGADGTSMQYWRLKEGWRRGPDWILKPTPTGKLYFVTFDSNVWKSRFHRSLATELADDGSFELYSDAPGHHAYLAASLRSEFPTDVKGKGGREMQLWRQQPNTDNHLLDACVLSFVGASLSGIRSEFDPVPAAKRRNVRKVRRIKI